MSESVSYGGESPSNHSNAKYSNQYYSHSSESPSSSESYHSSSKHNISTETENIEKAKTLLKEVEVALLLFALQKNINQEESIKSIFRAVMIQNEDILIKNPTFNTVYSCYEKKFNSLSQEFQTKEGIHDIILQGLAEQSQKQLTKPSKLKYW